MSHQKPNILIFMVDQQRYDACGCFGSQICRTPNLDRLAQQGTKFTNAYASVPLCTPTRASFWSGLWPSHHGVLINTHWKNPVTKPRLDRETPILSELFRDAGYATAHFGKWHVGPDSEMSERGFDHVVTRDDFQADLRARNVQPQVRDLITRDYIRKGYPYAGITSAEGEDFLEIWLCRRAEEWLQSQVQAKTDADQPFFCCISTPGPHPGYIIPESWATAYDPAEMPLWPNTHDDLSTKPSVHRIFRDQVTQSGSVSDTEWQTCIARYNAFVTLIDQELGRMLDLLDELGVTDNTLVLFVSDHGDLIGAHGLFDKGPFMYDEQLHIPLAARWPGVIPQNQTCDEMVTFLDLMPTLAEAAQLSLPKPVDGRSLLPFMRGEPVPDWPDDIYCQYYGEALSHYSIRMVQNRQYKYVYYPLDVDELYDLEADPWEMDNLIDAPESGPVLAEMKERMVVWMERTEDVMLDWNIDLREKGARF